MKKLYKKLLLSGRGKTSAGFISPAVNGQTTWDLDKDGPLVLSTYGAYRFTPISDVRINAKMWGAGGGSRFYNNTGSSLFSGGAGAYASGDIILQGGMTYLIWVGQGGNHGSDTSAPFGGGGKTGLTSIVNPGSGGGLSGIFSNNNAVQINAVLIAGAGGGACNGKGGAGGYPAGQAGTDSASAGGPGLGGTQTAGGAGGISSGTYGPGTQGTALAGGSYITSSFSGAGGGSGYWGGGSGCLNNTNGESGGGGSCFASGSVINPTFASGTYETPGNSADPDRGSAGGVNYPSSATLAQTCGNDGLVKLTFVSLQ